MPYGQELFHLGIAVMGVSAGLAVLSAVLLTISGRRLKNTLDREYGKKRHG